LRSNQCLVNPRDEEPSRVQSVVKASCRQFSRGVPLSALRRRSTLGRLFLFSKLAGLGVGRRDHACSQCPALSSEAWTARRIASMPIRESAKVGRPPHANIVKIGERTCRIIVEYVVRTCSPTPRLNMIDTRRGVATRRTQYGCSRQKHSDPTITDSRWCPACASSSVTSAALAPLLRVPGSARRHRQ
jgi:hypothetical protein